MALEVLPCGDVGGLMGLSVDERWKERSSWEAWALGGFASGWSLLVVHELQGQGRRD